MFLGLPTASLAIIRLFDHPFLFTVPAYQRPYAWTAKEAGQLLEDLTVAAGLYEADGASADYFLGTIILLDPESDGPKLPPPYSGPRVYEVVDGQQRLMTITLMASVLRDLIDSDPDSGSSDGELANQLHAMIAVTPNPRDIVTRKGRIQLRESEQSFLDTYVTPRGPRKLFPPNPPLIGSSLADIQEFFVTELDSLTRSERRRLAVYLIEDCHLVLFVSPDIDRAHRLFTVLNDRGKPLERNDIIKAEVLRGLPAEAAARALTRWDQAYAATGGDLETFLGYLRFAQGLSRQPIISAIRNLVRDLGSERFVEEQLAPMAAALNAVRTLPDRPEAAAHPALASSLIALNRLGSAEWVPAAMLAMARLQEAPDAVASLMGEIERFAYLLRLLGVGGPKRQRRFAPVIDAIRDRESPALVSAAFEITRDELRSINFYLKDLHRRNAGLCKLVLMRIEDELSGQMLTSDPKEWTVEHILPTRPAATSDWRQVFPESDERAQCQTSLGNLALVTELQNDRAKNRRFLEKLEIYRDTSAASAGLISNASVLSAPVWDAERVRAREGLFMDTLMRLWRIDGAPVPPANRVGLFNQRSA